MRIAASIPANLVGIDVVQWRMQAASGAAPVARDGASDPHSRRRPFMRGRHVLRRPIDAIGARREAATDKNSVPRQAVVRLQDRLSPKP